MKISCNMKPAILLTLLAALGTAQSAFAADGPLLNFPLGALGSDKEILVLEINLEPGQASQPHRHNGHVFVYVLEGRVNMQVAGGELQTLGPGEMFYENPQVSTRCRPTPATLSQQGSWCISSRRSVRLSVRQLLSSATGPAKSGYNY